MKYTKIELNFKKGKEKSLVSFDSREELDIMINEFIKKAELDRDIKIRIEVIG